MQKKWLLLTAAILLVALLVSACGKKNAGGASPSPSDAPPTASAETTEPSLSPSPSPDTTPGGSAASEEEQKAILDIFKALLKTPGNEKAAITALRKDISKLSPENANQMILSFEAYQEDVNPSTLFSQELMNLIQASEEPYNEKTLNDLSKITDADLRNALQVIFDRGYKIIVPEGMYEAVIDYDVYKAAEEYVTPDIAAYIGIMAAESEQRMSEDAGIIIPIDEVLARALAAESFIITYHDSVKFDQVEQKYMNYVDAYFFGQNNTPAFDYFTKKLNQEFLDSYTKAAAGGKDSAIVKAAAQYLVILKDNDYTLTAAVTDYRKNLTNGLKNTAS
jgi:hypothetical protein